MSRYPIVDTLVGKAEKSRQRASQDKQGSGGGASRVESSQSALAACSYVRTHNRREEGGACGAATPLAHDGGVILPIDLRYRPGAFQMPESTPDYLSLPEVSRIVALWFICLRYFNGMLLSFGSNRYYSVAFFPCSGLTALLFVST